MLRMQAKRSIANKHKSSVNSKIISQENQQQKQSESTLAQVFCTNAKNQHGTFGRNQSGSIYVCEIIKLSSVISFIKTQTTNRIYFSVILFKMSKTKKKREQTKTKKLT